MQKKTRQTYFTSHTITSILRIAPLTFNDGTRQQHLLVSLDESLSSCHWRDLRLETPILEFEQFNVIFCDST